MAFELLVYMIAAHYLLDYALQGEWMSKAKNPHFDPVPGESIWGHVLYGHAHLHATAVLLITHSWTFFFAELIIHAATDYAKCKGRFGYNADQLIHIACKSAYAAIWGVAAVVSS